MVEQSLLGLDWDLLFKSTNYRKIFTASGTIADYNILMTEHLEKNPGPFNCFVPVFRHGKLWGLRFLYNFYGVPLSELIESSCAVHNFLYHSNQSVVSKGDDEDEDESVWCSQCNRVLGTVSEEMDRKLYPGKGRRKKNTAEGEEWTDLQKPRKLTVHEKRPTKILSEILPSHEEQRRATEKFISPKVLNTKLDLSDGGEDYSRLVKCEGTENKNIYEFWRIALMIRFHLKDAGNLKNTPKFTWLVFGMWRGTAIRLEHITTANGFTSAQVREAAQVWANASERTLENGSQEVTRPKRRREQSVAARAVVRRRLSTVTSGGEAEDVVQQQQQPTAPAVSIVSAAEATGRQVALVNPRRQERQQPAATATSDSPAEVATFPAVVVAVAVASGQNPNQNQNQNQNQNVQLAQPSVVNISPTFQPVAGRSQSSQPDEATITSPDSVELRQQMQAEGPSNHNINAEEPAVSTHAVARNVEHHLRNVWVAPQREVEAMANDDPMRNLSDDYDDLWDFDPDDILLSMREFGGPNCQQFEFSDHIML